MLQTLNFPISGLHSPTAYIEMLQTLKFPISSNSLTHLHESVANSKFSHFKFALHPTTYIYEMFAILFCFHQPTHQISRGALPIFDELPNFQPILFLNMYSDWHLEVWVPNSLAATPPQPHSFINNPKTRTTVPNGDGKLGNKNFHHLKNCLLNWGTIPISTVCYKEFFSSYQKQYNCN